MTLEEIEQRIDEINSSVGHLRVENYGKQEIYKQSFKAASYRGFAQKVNSAQEVSL